MEESLKYRVLLVEDDKIAQMAFQRLVREENLPYDYTIAGSVEEANSILAGREFDIAIVDYLLGDGTAFDILGQTGDTPVVLVTGAGDEEVATKAYKAGAKDYLIKDAERHYLMVVPITVENVITHHRMETQLKILANAIMSADDGIYITDVDDRILFVNTAFCRMYDYEDTDIIGKKTSILWAQDGPTKDARSVLGALGDVHEVGFHHRRKDGSKFPAAHVRSSIKDENGSFAGVIGICSDISGTALLVDKVMALNPRY